MIETRHTLEQQIATLQTEDERTAYLASHPELVSKEVIESLADAVRKVARIDVRKTLAFADFALMIAKSLDEQEAFALAFRSKATALWLMGNCTSAVELFERAIDLFDKSGQQSEVGRTLSTSIQAHALLGDYDGAFAAAERARRIFAELGETLRLARLNINIANIYHRRNQFREALDAYALAYDQLLPLGDSEAIGVALHNIAVCQIALDDYPGALSTYRELRAVCEKNGMPLLAAQADYNIAYLYYLRGEFTQALDLLRRVRETYRQNDDTYHLGLCDLDQSEIYLELSLTDEAVEMSASSLQQFRALGMGFETARSLANLAIALSQQGNASRAVSLFAEARSMFEGEKNQAWPFLLDLYQAAVLFTTGKLVEAYQLCLRAELFFRSRADIPTISVLCLLLRGSIALRFERGEEARDSCRDALHLLEDLETPVLSFRAYYLMGQIHEFFGEADNAYGCYQASRTALEKLRGGLQAEELKIGFLFFLLVVFVCLVLFCLFGVFLWLGVFKHQSGGKES